MKTFFLPGFALVVWLVARAAAYDPLVVSEKPAGSSAEFTVHDAKRGRDIPVRVYLPGELKAAPVVLFSHGLGGSRGGSAFLGEHWSRRGYVAVFLQHAGSDDAVWKGQAVAERMPAMQKAASLQNFLLRVQDVVAVLDQLAVWSRAGDHPLAGRLDLDRVGMSGHSFGAVTTQAVSGQSTALGGALFTDPRIKAAVILSPSSPVADSPAAAFGGVKTPWLLMTGTEDVARLGGVTIGTSDVATRLAVYDALPAGGKYELVLEGANHFAFTDRADIGEAGGVRNPNHHRVILALSTAFWDAYLREDPEARAWLDGEAPRGLMEEKDRWLRK